MDMNQRLELQPALTAQQQAYIHIQDQIVSGSLAGGSRLRPEVIAQELGISRMPVREAIRQLDAEGYVTIRPNRGAVVTARTPEQIVELFEMRAVLEGLAVRIGSTRITPVMVDDLRLHIQRLKKIQTNELDWVERHDHLHDLFCATSGRPQLCAECRRLRLAVSPYLRLYIKMNTNPERPGYEHENILQAVRSGDPELAERGMRAHVMANAEGIAECLRLSHQKATSMDGRIWPPSADSGRDTLGKRNRLP